MNKFKILCQNLDRNNQTQTLIDLLLTISASMKTQSLIRESEFQTIVETVSLQARVDFINRVITEVEKLSHD